MNASAPSDPALVVAIDGPAGAGKSTLARRLAQALGYRLLDTGALYRAVTLLAQRRGVSWEDEAGLAEIAASLDVRFRFVGDKNHVLVGEEDLTEAIRAPEISHATSRVSTLPAVRRALLDLQRRLARAGGVVVEGRDTGTVVFPEAEVKFFLTASDEVRARRRHDELRDSGHEASFESTLAEMRTRDERDAGRAIAPLRRAPDAILVDSSEMSIDAVIDTMLAEVDRCRHLPEATSRAPDARNG
ncbi:(d)CMP kinase [Haliangium sp.]|uniref:(d)CMP kinase n=1 Tax=Haliangium sp. TaxID=2663208 RepID=UPI003D10B78A